jgi:excinuclease UvrABC ATPase subunit
MLGTLKKLSDSGHVVVVATEQEEYLNISDKIITLGKNEHHVY